LKEKDLKIDFSPRPIEDYPDAPKPKPVIKAYGDDQEHEFILGIGRRRWRKKVGECNPITAPYTRLELLTMYLSAIEKREDWGDISKDKCIADLKHHIGKQMKDPFLASAWHGTKITPMDIDALFHRANREGDHFLALETKAPDTMVPQGQAITLTALWRSGWTIIHVEGKGPDSIERYRVYSGIAQAKDEDFGSLPMVPGTAADVCYCVYRWRCRIEGREIITQKEFERLEWVREYEKHESGSTT
jgi:hypothetical protein